MDDVAAREALRIRMEEAETVLKRAEIEYAQLEKQMEIYKRVIEEKKREILVIKQRMNSSLH